MSSTFHYFAYGSNLLTARLRERTPSAQVLGVGRLDLHELRWHKRGRDGSGKCDVVPSPQAGSHVQGVVYEILAAEKPALDAAESLGTGYAEKQVVITLETGRVTACVYVALLIDAGAVPYDWYKNLVVAGAREHRLAADYILQLENTPAQTDPDLRRSAHHAALVNRT